MTDKISVYIETYGCSANQSHSELMGGILRDSGCLIVDKPEKSDIIIINTCIVKEPTEKKIINRINKLKKKYPEKRFIIAGCMVTGEYKLAKKTLPDSSLLGPRNCLDVYKCVTETEKGRKVEYFQGNNVIKSHTKKRINKYTGIVEISQGCLGNCSYCIVNKAKGNLTSYTENDIIRDIRMSLKEGCKEIWLTSQDCGCYGIDIDTNLTKLLNEVTKIDENFRVRLGMSNLNYVKNMISELIDIYRDKKMYNFLHIPIQSGSDKILKKMNRYYVTKDFIETVKKIREFDSFFTIWTDVIVGFPGETEKDFKETKKIIKETEPDFVNISKFGIRPHTKAAEMDQLTSETIKNRSRELTKICDKIALKMNKRWVNKECQVLVTKKGKDKNQYIGRNEAYKSVLIETKKDIIGNFIKAEVIEAKNSYLIGKLK